MVLPGLCVCYRHTRTQVHDPKGNKYAADQWASWAVWVWTVLLMSMFCA